MCIILQTDRPFLSPVFPQLRLSDTSLLEGFIFLLDPAFYSPLAEAFVSGLKASLPGDLSGITIEPLADSTHRAAEVLDENSSLVIPVLPSSCSGDSGVPLAVIAKIAKQPLTVDTHGCEGSSPPRQNSGGSQETGSPRFSSFLLQGLSMGCDGAVSSKNEHSKLFLLLLPIFSLDVQVVGRGCCYGCHNYSRKGISSVVVQLVIPGEGGSEEQSTSKQLSASTSKAAATAVRLDSADIDDECDVDATLPGTSAQSVGVLGAAVSDAATSHTLDPFAARK